MEFREYQMGKSKKGLPVPFELGTLQSEAYAQFGFTPRKTQQIAQNLYVEGYTSYPRTSSQKLPESLFLFYNDGNCDDSEMLLVQDQKKVDKMNQLIDENKLNF